MAEIKRIGVMTCGGDCPGLNAVVRGVVLAAFKNGWTVLGIEDSMQGLINLDYRSPHGNLELTPDTVEDILSRGGTILGCDNKSDPFRFAVKQADGTVKETDVSTQVGENFRKLGLDALVVIGGDGSMAIARKLMLKLNIPIVGVPKTIDNDLAATDFTFGFDTAVGTIMNACDRIKDTAKSHDRVLVVEVMGRDAGWLALYGGMASGAEFILIPEIPYDVEVIARRVKELDAQGRPSAIIVMAEGAKSVGGDASMLGDREAGKMARYAGAGNRLGYELSHRPDIRLETRVSVLGYVQRGGSPSNFDRILGTRLGVHAVRMIKEQRFGRMAALRTPDITDVSFEELEKTQRLVEPDSSIIEAARITGVCFGDKWPN